MLGKIMIATMSFTGFASGTLLACIAERFPNFSARLEMMAGLLLIFGLACVGIGLSLYVHF